MASEQAARVPAHRDTTGRRARPARTTRPTGTARPTGGAHHARHQAVRVPRPAARGAGAHRAPVTAPERSLGAFVRTGPARTVAVAGATAAITAGMLAGFTGPALGATPSQFAALRMCESSDNYAANTGNGFYGAYQFNLQTWDGLGYTGLPSQAPPAVQDQAAEQLQAARGWEPWPACSAMLGLNNAPAAPAPAVVAAAAAAVDPASAPTATFRPPVTPTTPPEFDGVVLSTALARTRRADVALWQARMAARGWPVRVTGYFTAHCAAVAHAFAVEFHLPVAHAGQVDAAVWNAAWTLKVTEGS